MRISRLTLDDLDLDELPERDRVFEFDPAPKREGEGHYALESPPPWPSGLEPAAFAVAYEDAAPAWPAPLLLAE